MKLKTAILIGTTWLSLGFWEPATSHTKQDLSTVLSTSLSSSHEKETPSHKRSQNITTMEKNHSKMYKITIKDLDWSPFFGEKQMIQPTYWNLLGYSQAETIMKRFNHYGNSSEFSAQQLISEEDNLNFPLIYPELFSYFPKGLNELMALPSFQKYKNQIQTHTLIITQCDNWKIALAYYHHWELTMATYVSPWTIHRKTLTGIYPLNHSSIYRRSKKYRNSAMPYSIQIEGGYFLHQWRSNGKPQSHGCIRVPGLYQKWLYEHLPKNSQSSVIILEGLYQPTLSSL